MEFLIESEGGETLRLPEGGADLVAFLSFAVSRGFGAVHPAIALADFLSERGALAWGPLTTFYEADPDDAEDREKLDLAWQPAGRLADSFGDLASALQAPEAAVFIRRAALAGLTGQTAGAAAAVAALPPESRVRMVYRL